MSLEKTPMESAEDITKRGSTSTIDLKAVRAKLQKAGAPDVWRSLDEVSGTAEFKACAVNVVLATTAIPAFR